MDGRSAWMEGERTARAHDERLIFSDSDGLPAALAVPEDTGPLAVPAAAARPASRSAVLTVLWKRVGTALETERDFGTGFVAVPVLLAAGAVIYFCLPAEPGLILIVAAVVSAAGATTLVRRALWMRTAGLAA
ncbi:MAG: hypothetical protein KDJ43_01090, partial [Rhizobiaceae bacterium]|nr:hypothetical protein [Rhizobiaceae bacterium]